MWSIYTFLCGTGLHTTFNHIDRILSGYNIKYAGLLPSKISMLFHSRIPCEYGQVYSGKTSQPSKTTVNKNHWPHMKQVSSSTTLHSNTKFLSIKTS